MLLRATINHRSTVRNNPHSNSRILSNLLMDTIVFLTIRHLIAALNNSGQVHLSMVSRHSMAGVVVVVVSIMVEVVMKPLLWGPQFAWDLTTSEETTWLKRAMASPHSIQIIRVLHLFHSLSLHIKVIHHRTFMEDSVHHLTPIHSTLALIGPGVT